MAVKAKINPEVLKWARESAKFSIEEAAEKLKIKNPVEKLTAWENGSDLPTIKQADDLAKAYRRPLAAFFLPKPPKDFQVLSDFRKIEDSEFGKGLNFLLREVTERQEWMSEYLTELEEPELDFVGRFDIEDDINQVAKNIKDELTIGRNESKKDIRFWLEKAENLRIFILRPRRSFHGLYLISVEEARGFVISDKMAPFIFINGNDHELAQKFTLIHELVHLWIDKGGISNLKTIELRDKNLREYDPVEVFCNRVTAEILMPEKEIHAEFGKKSINFDLIVNKAAEFGVSPLALFTRLLNLQYIDLNYYNDSKKQMKEIWEEKKLKEVDKGSSGGSYHRTMIARNGKLYSMVILDGYKNETISAQETYSLLDVKIDNLKKYENTLFKG